MATTTELLPTLNADVLKGLARQLALPRTITRKPELIVELDRYVRERLSDLLAHCSNTEKQLLAEATYNRGRIDPAAFQAKYGKPCPLPDHPCWGRTGTLLFLLLDFQGGAWWMPPSIAERLRALLEKPAPATIQMVETLPKDYKPPEKGWRKITRRPIHIYEGERIVFLELRTVLKLVQAGKLKVTDKGGRPTEDTVRLISEALVVPDFLLDPPPEETTQYTEHSGAIRAHAWGVLVQQCKWSKAKGGRLVLTAEGQRLLSSMEASEFAVGVRSFLLDDEFDELNRINHIRGQSGGGKRYLTPPSERRRRISASLALWPVNQWIGFDETVNFLLASGHNFVVTTADYTLYFCELQYGSLGDQGGQINRQYMRALLFESLATLGLVDIGYVHPHYLWPEFRDSWGADLCFCSRYDGLLYLRLNPLGAYCLGASDTYQPGVPPDPPSWRVLPNREIALVDSHQVSPADRHMLEQFATEKSEYVWELDEGRILSHLESGGKVEDVLQFLESNCTPPVPETVRTMLSDLARRGTSVRTVEEALLIEFEDATTAALIAHDPQAAKYCWLAGDRRLAAPKRNSRAFRSAMKKLGFIVPDGQFPT